ncbi:MAG: hypothetical protein Q8N60_03730, partial [Candidatus Diapherotrites archaeon]|nr:hypothetical protein [Candidatus Diapherotrites archaeon]
TFAACNAVNCTAGAGNKCVKTATGDCYKCAPLKSDMTTATAVTNFASCGLGAKAAACAGTEI